MKLHVILAYTTPALFEVMPVSGGNEQCVFLTCGGVGVKDRCPVGGVGVEEGRPAGGVKVETGCPAGGVGFRLPNMISSVMSFPP